jgi:putative lipoprotein
MQLKIWTVIPALAVLSGCVTDPNPVSPAPALEGQWQVEDINNTGVIDNSLVTLNVTGNTVSGSAGCNNFTGSFNQAVDTISISKLTLTRKMCPPALMHQEQKYMQALSSIEQVEQASDKPWVFLTNENAEVSIKLIATPANPETAATRKQDNSATVRHQYNCGKVGNVTMSFVGPEAITLTLPEESLVLKRERSASGARYVAAQSYFWNKGNTATLSYQGTEYSCTKF